MNTWDRWGQIYENKSLNETNDPYLRFLSGLKYDEVYRAQHERERNNCQQNDSLDCGQDKNGVPILQVKDDAGKYCCPNEMSIIELRIEKTKWCSNSGSGHAFLVQIKNGNVENAWGFLTKGNIFFSHGVFSGKLEGEHEKYYDFYISYNACEESVKILQKKYEQTKNDKPYYNFLNWRMDYYNCIGMTSYNCIGMASKLLEDANFKAPYISSFPAIPGCNPIHIPLNILLSIVSPTTNILYFVNIIHYGFFNFKYSDKIHSKDER